MLYSLKNASSQFRFKPASDKNTESRSESLQKVVGIHPVLVKASLDIEILMEKSKHMYKFREMGRMRS